MDGGNQPSWDRFPDLLLTWLGFLVALICLASLAYVWIIG